MKHTRGTREDEERSRRPHHNLKFIPRRPNMGGAWERLVRSVKTALAATLRERSPREEVLHTLLLEAEHIRWLREYLPTLVPAGRGDPICRAPAEGDIVLIVDSSSPRYSWPRGRIKKTYPGPDNQIRVVDVETTGGVLRRPTSKIVVLVSAEATAVPLGVVHPTQLLANRHLVKLGLIKSERKKTLSIIDHADCKKSADQRKKRAHRERQSGCGLTRR
ncbi:hypothetical protein EVAR_24964_1 [Eumeta japonica]|uniref:DUF5641 domain-containing protein n=1 Tax=Eumeta variegata TaxID=151549 RepID=A0A4C1ZJV9_EUMVA|nr:hypothetical protein EVAR_24964_1 [Eumeta japonica]